MIHSEHILRNNSTIKEALIRLNSLAENAIVFITDENGSLTGSLTDGDIRRGLIDGMEVTDTVEKAMNRSPKYLLEGDIDIHQIIQLRKSRIDILPVLSGERKEISRIINMRKMKSFLPVDAVIMAGGKGQRLAPLTLKTPKPLLKVGEKPIIEHNIDHLANFGITNISISINYLGEQLVNYFEDGSQKGLSIDYLEENEPLGTIGAVSQKGDFKNNYVLVMNSDLLTNINYEQFFLSFIESGAELSVVSIPYQVNIPYAVLNTENDLITGFEEKPNYTYYSNGGIYLMKKEIIDEIPKNSHYNATDLMNKLIDEGRSVHAYKTHDYWLDIGKPEDYKKAELDIQHLVF